MCLYYTNPFWESSQRNFLMCLIIWKEGRGGKKLALTNFLSLFFSVLASIFYECTFLLKIATDLACNHFQDKDRSIAVTISLLFIILAELQISRVFGDRGMLLHEVILALLFSEFGFRGVESSSFWRNWCSCGPQLAFCSCLQMMTCNPGKEKAWKDLFSKVPFYILRHL